MQSTAGKRVLSTLASKLHPQLPLSPRESEQLLHLLTTSFRAHLDRAHPTPQHKHPKPLTAHHAPRSRSPVRAPSSYASASQHIDSIVTNPLFAVKPRRRGSEPAAIDVLRDPLTWFATEVASGSATLQKAAICLDLHTTAAAEGTERPSAKSPAFTVAEWLRTSGMENSKEFVGYLTSKQGRRSTLFDNLVAMLFIEGHEAVPWRWYIRSLDQRVKETHLDINTVLNFKKQLLLKMVSAQASTSLDEALAVFMQAFRMAQVTGLDSAYDVLRPAGAHLVDSFTSTRHQSIPADAYDSFLLSSERWLGNWSRAAQAMLWLHHPQKPGVSQALHYINDPEGATLHVRSSPGRRKFLVQLCLGTARQLLEEERYADARLVMEFTKAHFADLVLDESTLAALVPAQKGDRRRARHEKENLELLDGLVPT